MDDMIFVDLREPATRPLSQLNLFAEDSSVSLRPHASGDVRTSRRSARSWRSSGSAETTAYRRSHQFRHMLPTAAPSGVMFARGVVHRVAVGTEKSLP